MPSPVTRLPDGYAGRIPAREFQTRLLAWFRREGRRFPWRQTNDPYKILVAELLLQKTHVRKVPPVYQEFVKCYPSPAALAGASLQQVHELVQPLGLFYRAERLISVAKDITERHAGVVPNSREDLLALKGVGDYAANAVLCFAYGQQVALLDTNIVRLLERVFDIKTDKARARTDKAMWKVVESLIPDGRAREFNLALLDFAALVCTARNPSCETCSLNHLCIWYKGREQTEREVQGKPVSKMPGQENEG
jgi:A/G-specific adenine glycosylase